jgi:hypothetical protein
MNNTFYCEVMDEDELAFIQRKHDKESAAYLYTMNRMLFFVVFVPAGIALFFAAANSLSWQGILHIYIVGFIALFIFFSLVSVLSYFHKLHKYKMDLKHKTKVVEQAIIKSSQYMPHNDTWHFYLLSQTKLSIEVSQEAFHSQQPGDEINIEYSKYAKEYFGYF